MTRIAPTDVETSEFDPSWDRVKRITHGPLSFLRRALWWIRKTFFTRPRSKTDALRVQRTKAELTEHFGRVFFEPGWETSYQYRNEILNYRRVEYDDELHPGIDWWQVHIRGYPVPPEAGKAATTVDLTAHFEPEPVEHPDSHVSKEFIDVERGLSTTRAILRDYDIEFEVIGSGH